MLEQQLKFLYSQDTIKRIKSYTRKYSFNTNKAVKKEQRNKKIWDTLKTKQNKKATISMITLNVSGLISPIKRQRLPDWLIRQQPNMCWQSSYTTLNDSNRMKVKWWQKTYHSYSSDKKARVAIPILDKIDFKTNNVNGDK